MSAIGHALVFCTQKSRVSCANGKAVKLWNNRYAGSTGLGALKHLSQYSKQPAHNGGAAEARHTI